jgi:hypothetical protein
MTAQINDSFLFQDKKYSIVGVNGESLFHPANYGLLPLPRITSCWRGYVCTYKTSGDKLLLDTLQTNLDLEGPAINNILPVFSTKNTFNNIYQHLDLHIDFSGGMLVANGFIQVLYVHMGFHPAWKYETIFELVFSQGTLIETKDVSRQMAELRDKMTRQPLQPGTGASRQDLEDWIASTFKRSYRF